MGIHPPSKGLVLEWTRDSLFSDHKEVAHQEKADR
jgi:hypothetical protein